MAELPLRPNLSLFLCFRFTKPSTPTSLLSTTLHSGGSAAASLRFQEDDLALGRAEFGRRFMRASQDKPLLFVLRRAGGGPLLVFLVSSTIAAVYRSLHAEFRMIRSSLLANHRYYTNDNCAFMHAVSAEDGAFATG